jgi:hypothetical protein
MPGQFPDAAPGEFPDAQESPTPPSENEMLFIVTFQGYYATTPSPGYTIFNVDGSVFQARTTAGIIQPVMGVNIFQVRLDTGVIPSSCSIFWDDGGSPVNWAATAYNSGSGGGTVIIVNDNLTCGS